VARRRSPHLGRRSDAHPQTLATKVAKILHGLQRVLSWWIRLPVIALLLFAIFVDGAGWWYRLANHYPLTGSVPGLPPTFNGWQLYIHRGLDLSGGSRLLLQMNGMPPNRNPSEVQTQTVGVLQNRINALGVNEPVVQPSGKDRIIVELAGVPASRAEQVVGKTARLVTTTWVPDASVTNGPYPGFKPQITNLDSSMVNGANASLDQSGGNGWVVNVTLDSQGAGIFGKISTTAYNACQQQGCPQQHVAEWLDLTQDDVDHWNERANTLYQTTNKQGGKLVTDPVIQQPITGGQFFISGNFNPDSAKDLATLLNAGSLPVSLSIIQSTDVDASLGADSVRSSLIAGVLGLLIVIIFMISLYRLPGLLASVALVFYAGVVLMVFKVAAITLTLAGLAGFVLSVGMAVDANVLIFERFKEEMRAGRTIGAAVEAAVRRAWPAVRDSNTSTLITSAVLYFMGSGTVKGFAITLLIGVLISLISSIIVTHNLLAIVLNLGWARRPRLLGAARGRG
jgi:preprotein translocase subunit SecD